MRLWGIGLWVGLLWGCSGSVPIADILEEVVEVEVEVEEPLERAPAVELDTRNTLLLGKDQGPSMVGFGVAVVVYNGPEGVYAITCRHVTRAEPDVAGYWDSQGRLYKLVLGQVTEDRIHDLAMVQLEVKGWPHVVPEIRRIEALAPKEGYRSIRVMRQRRPYLVDGLKRGAAASWKYPALLDSTAEPSRPGDSGTGIYDALGRLVAILSAALRVRIGEEWKTDQTRIIVQHGGPIGRLLDDVLEAARK